MAGEPVPVDAGTIEGIAGGGATEDHSENNKGNVHVQLFITAFWAVDGVATTGGGGTTGGKTGEVTQLVIKDVHVVTGGF